MAPGGSAGDGDGYSREALWQVRIRRLLVARRAVRPGNQTRGFPPATLTPTRGSTYEREFQDLTSPRNAAPNTQSASDRWGCAPTPAIERRSEKRPQRVLTVSPTRQEKTRIPLPGPPPRLPRAFGSGSAFGARAPGSGWGLQDSIHLPRSLPQRRREPPSAERPEPGSSPVTSRHGWAPRTAGLAG